MSEMSDDMRVMGQLWASLIESRGENAETIMRLLEEAAVAAEDES